MASFSALSLFLILALSFSVAQARWMIDATYTDPTCTDIATLQVVRVGRVDTCLRGAVNAKLTINGTDAVMYFCDITCTTCTYRRTSPMNVCTNSTYGPYKLTVVDEFPTNQFSGVTTVFYNDTTCTNEDTFLAKEFIPKTSANYATASTSCTTAQCVLSGSAQYGNSSRMFCDTTTSTTTTTTTSSASSTSFIFGTFVLVAMVLAF